MAIGRRSGKDFLYGLGIKGFPGGFDKEQDRLRIYAFSLRDLVMEKHDFNNEQQITLLQISLIQYSVAAFQKELLLQRILNDEWETLSRSEKAKLAHEIMVASQKRHGALKPLNISVATDVEIEAIDFGDKPAESE